MKQAAALKSDSEVGSVTLERVTKSFRRQTRSKKSYSTLKSLLLSPFSKSSEEFLETCALSELSLTISPGQAVGVIGRNGSGKSTLLKLIAGIYRADGGTIKVNGRISALIELGAGFHPDFTGRENVYLGGIMFGMSRREIDERFEEIVEFAELEDFIDDPVRTYSSGMYMRLGFSLAIHTDPDILLVDEVLAVGDAAFIHRCQDRISDLKRRGKTLIFVTHDLDSVKRWCDEAIWLNKGEVLARGEPQRVIDQYLQQVEEKEEAALQQEQQQEEAPAVEEEQEVNRWGNGSVEIADVKMRKAGEEHWLFHTGDAVEVDFSYRLKNAVEEDLVFGVGILRADGLTVFGTNTDIESVKIPTPIPSVGRVSFRISSLQLLEGSYFLDIAAHRKDGTPYDYHHRCYKFSIRNPVRYHGVYLPEHSWRVE
jgi:ABC-type polysaccharide/polyol phosphate transport system ATPase subunit